MWPKSYKDYPKDQSLKKERVEPGKGITGCEMHEVNGWGNTLHQSPPRKKGLISDLLEKFLGGRG